MKKVKGKPNLFHQFHHQPCLSFPKMKKGKKTKVKRSSKENVLVFCAHSDDQIFGPGGTIAKYAKEGKEICVVIFSYGEMTHPWLKRKVSIEMRVGESRDAAKVVGYDKNIFLGLTEGKFAEEVNQKGLKKTLKRLILEKKPKKVFTHSIDDPHQDHRDVYYTTAAVIEELRYDCELYTFDVWNPINFRKRDSPQLYVDISDTFNLKIKALNQFKSQKLSLITLLWSVYLRAFVNGLHNNCRWAERFYKLK